MSVNESFYDRNLESIESLFDIYGVPLNTKSSLEDVVEVTQPWVKGDHARPEHTVSVTAEQSGELHKIYDAVGIKKEITLAPGHYDQIIIPGAVQRGNNRRLGFLATILAAGDITADRLVLLGGEREPYREVESTAIYENLKSLAGVEQTDKRVKEMVDGSTPAHETDLIRLAAAVQLGSMSLVSASQKFVGRTPIKRYDFEWMQMPVTLTHTKAVKRSNGPKRHTTGACMSDWLDHFSLPRDAKVGFIATNPHIERMARSAKRVITLASRSDIQLYHAGPGALDSYTHEIFRGEVARNLYEDLLDQKTS